MATKNPSPTRNRPKPPSNPPRSPAPAHRRSSIPPWATMNIDSSKSILREAIDRFSPTHIVSMVSGGKDSAASDQVARESGAKVDLVIHGNTRCGIPETTQFVRETYGTLGDYVEADAGTAYEDYVFRKGFFGRGIGAHGFSYRVLKATPFRKAVSKYIRKGRKGVRILLLNGARKDESENRQKHLKVFRQDPAAPGNIWVNIIHDWSQDDRDRYLDNRATPINPVAKALCRSGECMCGTMQTAAERTEAAVLYPQWGKWLSELEAEAKRLHGFGWGEPFPQPRDERQGDLFQPMCKDCMRAAA
ncbi:phosphoadenosine phosphosulfate reductase family protein [Nitratireductor sp. GCM10026969]|uniref:phosphoadenosine phosphosulfate reductase domain-containing protein n=1 Tax=Nitratireductor sp. GCM10026969 TaxID=3252645 RepID=UPI003619C863